MPSIFNVREYGAIGDGKVDDRAAIQSAIDAATKAGTGGTVYFPDGDYNVGTAGTFASQGVPEALGEFCLRLKGNVTLLGNGPASRITTHTPLGAPPAAGRSVIAVFDKANTYDVVMRNLRVANRGSPPAEQPATNRGVFFYRTIRCTVEGCIFHGHQVAFQSDRSSADPEVNAWITFRYNEVHTTIGHSVGSGSGFFCANSDAVEVAHNRFWDIAEHCIYICDRSANVRIIGNDGRMLRQNGQVSYGVQVYPASQSIADVTISANTFVGGDTGIFVGGPVLASRISIHGNCVSGTRKAGISVSNARSVALTGNTIFDAGDVGLLMGGDLGVLHASIVGNHVVRANRHGIGLCNSSYCTLHANVCSDNNQANSDCAGIWLTQSSQYNRLIGNVSHNWDGVTQAFGIAIDYKCSGNLAAYNALTCNRIKEYSNNSDSVFV